MKKIIRTERKLLAFILSIAMAFSAVDAATVINVKAETIQDDSNDNSNEDNLDKENPQEDDTDKDLDAGDDADKGIPKVDDQNNASDAEANSDKVTPKADDTNNAPDTGADADKVTPKEDDTEKNLDAGDDADKGTPETNIPEVDTPDNGDGDSDGNDNKSSAVEYSEITLITDEETITEESYEGENDELLQGFIESNIADELYGGISLFSLDNAGSNLKEGSNEKKLYDALKLKVTSIADGNLDSAVFKLKYSELGFKTTFKLDEFKEKDPDINSLFATENTLNEIVSIAVTEALNVDFSLAINSLLADCPYELYWYEKTVGATGSRSISVGGNSESISITDDSYIKICMTVDKPFRKESVAEGEDVKYSIDISKTSAAKTSAENISSILSEAETKSDYDKLAYYRDKICELVSYDHDAIKKDEEAKKQSSYDIDSSAPWQLISVFDGDSSTNVVCEGYSKAFAYLCENTTSFTSEDIEVYTVSGIMAGGTGAGGHMWNIVHMSDGNNYLVDVTNCDSGSIGAPDKLFMRGYNEIVSSGDYEGGYKLNVGSSALTYKYYDETTKKTYSNAQLALSNSDYNDETECVHTPPTQPGSVGACYSETKGYVHTYKCTACHKEIEEKHKISEETKKCAVCFRMDISGRTFVSNEVNYTGAAQYPTLADLTLYDDSSKSGDYEISGKKIKSGDSYVDYDGNIVDAGEYWVELGGKNACYGKTSGYYKIAKVKNTISLAGYSGSTVTLYLGQTGCKVPELTITNESAQNTEVKYESTNEDVLTVDNSGNITLVGAGSATIKVTAGETKNYSADEILYKVEVRSITPPEDSLIKYNGEGKKALYGKSCDSVAISADGYTISDSISGTFVASYSISKPETDGTVTKTLYFKNNTEGDPGKGAISNGKDISVTFDLTDPTISLECSGTKYNPVGDADFNTNSDFSFDTSASVKVIATDKDITNIKYTVNGGAESSISAGGSIPINTNGKHAVKITAIDNAGNTTSQEVTVFVYTAKEVSITSSETIVYDGSAIAEGTDFTLVKNGHAGNEKGYYYKKANDESSEYVSGLPIDAGTYDIKVIIGTDASNYYKGTEATKQLTISKAKAELSVSETSQTKTLGDTDFSLNITKVKGDGNITYSSSDTSVATIANDGTITIVGQGTTTIKAQIAGSDNYEQSEEAQVSLTVNYLTSPSSADIKYNNSAKKDWYCTEDGNVEISANGYTVSDSLNGTYASSYKITYNNDGEKNAKLYFKNANGQKTDAVDVKVNFDHTAPEFPSENGGIKIADNFFRTLLNTITFGKYYKETQSVTITASDATSGIDKYCYYVDESGSTTALTAEELATKQFTEKESSTIDNISSDSKYVYYVYVTDKAGNRSGYICSDGVVMDKTAPLLGEPNVDGSTLLDTSVGVSVTATDSGTGVKEYYLVLGNADLSATVTAANIATNESKKTSTNGSFSITGLSQNTKYYYAIAASDNSGNLAVKYGDFTTKKTLPEFSTLPTIVGYYGQKLSEMTLNPVSSNNNVAGSWSIATANPDSIYPVVYNTASVSVKFTPSDTTKYGEYETSVTPQVSYLATDAKIKVNDLGEEYDGWVKSGTITPPDGFKITTSLTEGSLGSTEWKEKLEYSTNGEQTVSYYLMNATSHAITAQRSYALKVDSVNPTGSISIGTDIWASLLTTITFGKFFKETKAVTISSSDTLSGVKSVEYLLSDSKIDESVLDGKNWTDGDNFNIEPNKKVIVYARITDNAGNKAFISSEGLVFDKDAPVVTLTPTGTSYNAVAGGTNVYDESVSVTVSAEKSVNYSSLSSITYSLDNNSYVSIANGESVTINTSGTHTLSVKATDQAGNEKVENLTVTVYKSSPAISITPGENIKYDASAIAEGSDFTLNKGSNAGTAVYSYKVKGADDSTYQSGLPMNPGSYTIKALINEDSTTFLKSVSTTADITIAKGDASLSAASNSVSKKFGDSVFSAGITKIGDGTISYVSSNTSVATVDTEGNVTIVGIGDTTITASMGATDKYNAAENKAVNLSVTYIDAPSSILYNNSAKKTWYNTTDGNVAISATGYTVSDSLNESYQESYTISYTADGEATKNLYFKNSLGQKSNLVEIKINYDHSVPIFPENGGIKIADSSWRTLLNTISFGLVLNETKTVTVGAEDSGSGIDKYYYYVDKSGSTDGVSETELNAKSFTEKTSEEIDTISADSKYVYYVYVTDKAGNRSSYICSNGVVYDTLAPAIETVSIPSDTLLDSSAIVTVSASDLGTGIKEYYLVMGNSSLSESVTSANIADNSSKKVSTNGSFSLIGLVANTDYYYAVAAVDNSSHVSEIKYGSFKTVKIPVTFAQIPSITGKYGQKLSGMSLSKTNDTSDDAVSGLWSITEDNKDNIYPSVDGTTAYEVTFTPDNEVYEPYVASLIPSVSYADIDDVVTITATSGANGWYVGNISLSAPLGYKITESLASNLGSTVWAESLPDITSDGATDKAYYLKSDSTGYISKAKSISVKKDSLLPEATVSIESSSWNKFLSSITFNTIFKDKKIVNISASDACSGVADIMYYKSASAKSYAEIQALSSSDWIKASSFSVEPEAKFVVYAKVVDNAGNVNYISSDGVIIEKVAEQTSPEQTSPEQNSSEQNSAEQSSQEHSNSSSSSDESDKDDKDDTSSTSSNESDATETNTSTAASVTSVSTATNTASVNTAANTVTSQTIASQAPTYVAPEKVAISESVRVNNDGTTTAVSFRLDGTVKETSSLPIVAASLNIPQVINMEAPTVVNKVELAVEKTNATTTAKIDKITTVVEAVTINGNVSITPQMVKGLEAAVAGQVGLANTKSGFEVKVNTVAANGLPMSVTVSTANLKNNATLKAYVVDPITGSYILTDVPAVKYNKNTGLTTGGLSGGLEYKLVSTKEASRIDSAIMNSVKVSNEFSNPVPAAPGGVVDMTKVFSTSLNAANVSGIEYSVSGNKAVINPFTGQLIINSNATKGTITVKVKVNLKNGKSKTIKTKIKIQ